MRHGYALRNTGSLLQREIPFPYGWQIPMVLASFLAVQSVLITLLFEPWGTDAYEAPFRTLRLSGYALCIVIPFVAFHAIDRQVYRWQGQSWRLRNELITRPLLILAIITCSYFYNINVINSEAPTLTLWWAYLLDFGLPNLPVMVPLAILLYYWLMKNRLGQSAPRPRKPLIIRGRNQGELLELERPQFIFAEAQQNYLAVHYRCKEGMASKLIRATLGELENQIDGALRIHRSYLVNPLHLERLLGNARKREARLRGVDRSLPVSPDFTP